jgi:hypothetical protein
VGAADVLEEDVVLTCELSNVPEEFAPCMTGCGRFWGNDRVPLLPLAIPFPFGLHELYLPLPFGMPFPGDQGLPLSDLPLLLLLFLPLGFPLP